MGRKALNRNSPLEALIMDLVDTDFKSAIKIMLKEYFETMSKRIKEYYQKKCLCLTPYTKLNSI